MAVTVTKAYFFVQIFTFFYLVWNWFIRNNICYYLYTEYIIEILA